MFLKTSQCQLSNCLWWNKPFAARERENSTVDELESSSFSRLQVCKQNSATYVIDIIVKPGRFIMFVLFGSMSINVVTTPGTGGKCPVCLGSQEMLVACFEESKV